MSRHYCTKHPQRGKSTYSKKNKAAHADRYGTYKEGKMVTPDHLVRWGTSSTEE